MSLTIQKLKYKDFHINQTSVPQEDEEGFDEYWEHQKELCINGCTIDGVYFTGFLYWHLNFWHTEVDYVDELGRIKQKYVQPPLRDNEWIIAEAIHRAETEHKGLALGGCRRLAKSVITSSYVSYGTTFDENSENVFVGVNGDDILITCNKISKGLNNVPEPFRWMRIAENWKNQVSFGIKKRDGTKIPFSHLVIRNLDGGNNEEAIAGTKPRKLIIEEAGKNSFLKSLQAAMPGLTTPFGWGCSPIVIFTGGDMEKYHDAKELMLNPQAFNFLEFEDPDKKRKVGLFLGNKYRQEAKVPSTLGDYLGIEDKKSELYKIPMYVSDEEKANEILANDLEMRKKSTDPSAYFKEKMYFPKTVDDIFLNTNKNMFNVAACKAQINRIDEMGLKGEDVELFHDGVKIQHRFSNKQFITEYPLKTQSPDAPIRIWDFPMPDPPKFLFIGSVDSYRFSSSEYSESLGVVYIFKRIHSLSGDGFQDTLVACYAARPEDRDDWNEQARLLIMYYNAYTLVENDEMGFIEYMKNKKCADAYLSPQPKFQKSLVVNSTLNRDFGVSRTSPKIREFLWSLCKRYLEETIHQEVDAEGKIISEIRGVTRIFDKALLEEFINFSPEANTDRIVSFSLALALANELDPLLGSFSDTKQSDRTKALNKIVSKSNSTFSTKISPFSPKKGAFTYRK